MNKLVRIFFDTNMCLQHPGLTVLAASKGVDLRTLAAGETVLFLNKAKNRVKLYSSNGVLSYLWKEKGMLDLHALAEIPRTFSRTGKISMNEALKESLLKRMPARTQIRQSRGVVRENTVDQRA